MEVFTEEFIYQVALYNDDRLKIEETLPDDIDPYEVLWDWCFETFGNGYDRWLHEYRESHDADLFCFKREEDRNWFVLRWT